MQQLGMIAGAGEFPLMIARQAHQDGTPLPTVALSAQVAADLKPYCQILEHYGPGQLTKILRLFRQHQVQQVVIVGKVSKHFLFAKPRLDLRALRLLRQVHDYRDDVLFRTISSEFAREGLEVVDQTRLLGHLLTPEGILGVCRPSRREWDDIRYGFRQAKHIVALDIGQTLVIRHRTVLAVEALEGTDMTIRRGCQYGHRGTVVVKVGRPRHDMRFDVPAVGLQTLQELIAGRATVLAVEAGTTLMVQRQELIARANAYRIALLGISPVLLQESGA